MKKFLLGLVLLLPTACPLFGHAQATNGFHRTAVALARSFQGVTAQVIPNAKVTVTATATGLAATIYSDPGLSSQITPAVVTADNSGNYGYYISLNYCVTETITSPGQGTQVIPNICDHGSALPIQHNGVAVTDQSLLNFCDNNSCGTSLPANKQQVFFGPDTTGGLSAWTDAASSGITPFTSPPIAGQYAIAYPTSFSTTCATGSNTTGKTNVTNGGCNSMVTWTFSAPGGNITTTSGATIPIANVTAVYPFVTSASTIQSGNATPANFFETTCTGTGVTLDVTQQGEQSGTLNFPLHQYTSSTSLTVSLANYNAMTCDISASEIDGSVGTPNIVNGSATVVGAYIYYTGAPVSSPNQIYVQGPLNFDTTTNILSLPLPYDVAFDFGVSGTTYAIENSNFTAAVPGLKTTFCAANANTTTAPTLNMNGWGAWTIFGPTGGALSLNDITPCAGASGTGQMINVQLIQTAAGMQWWLQNPKTEGGSAITGSGTANTLTKWTAANVIGNSSVTDDGSNPTRIPDSIDTNAIYREYTVDTGGVTGGQALCVTGNLDGGGQPKVLACPTTGHGAGFVGIAYQNASAGGLALACWSVGCSALFDGSVTQRDTAIVSTTTAGDLHDTGVTTAPGGENLVVNIAGPNTGAGTRALINITGATPAGGGGGGLPSGVLGQVPMNSGASAGSYLAQSPTVGVANGGAAITTSYTLLCDSATVSVGIQDRGKWAVVGSGGSVIIPDLAGTGCSGFYGGVQNSTSGAVTVSRQTSDTFNVYGPTQGAPTTGQTSFSLPAGSWATFNPSTSSTVYDVRIGTPPASSGSTVNVNGSPVSNPNFNGTTPAAAANSINTNFQVSASNVSNEITGDGNSAHYLSGTGIWSSPSATFAVQHTFTFTGAGTQSFTHNLGTQYPQYSCITTSGTNFSPTWMTWTDANNVSMTVPSATTQVCSFGGTTGSTAVTLPPPCPDSSGSGTAQSCTTTPTITVGANSCIAYSTTTPNSGTGLTLAVNGGAAAPIMVFNNNAWTTTLVAGQIASGKSLVACYDGTNWDIQANVAIQSSSAMVNIGGTVTWTGCTYSAGACAMSASSGVTISAIPGTYLHLKIIYSGSDSTNTDALVEAVLNGDTTAAHYISQRTASTGSTGNFSDCSFLTTGMCVGVWGQPTAGETGGGGVIDFPFYSSTTLQKTATGNGMSIPSSGTAYTGIHSGVWFSTSAITSIKLSTGDGGNMTGSIAIYGVN